MENDNTLSPEVLERIRGTSSNLKQQIGAINWGRIFFYAFIIGAFLIAFYSGYRIGRAVEKQEWEKHYRVGPRGI